MDEDEDSRTVFRETRGKSEIKKNKEQKEEEKNQIIKIYTYNARKRKTDKEKIQFTSNIKC